MTYVPAKPLVCSWSKQDGSPSSTDTLSAPLRLSFHVATVRRLGATPVVGEGAGAGGEGAEAGGEGSVVGEAAGGGEGPVVTEAVPLPEPPPEHEISQKVARRTRLPLNKTIADEAFIFRTP